MAITKTDIWRVADELNAEGIRPTLAAVRKKLGGGSFTTISEGMSEWRSRRQAAAVPRQDPAPPAVMEQLAEAGNALWALAVAQASARLEDERKRLDAQKDAMSERLAEAVELADALTLENEHLRARVAQLEPVERERDKLASQLSEVKRRSSEELARCMEKANRRDTEATEARKEARAADENAARLQGQLEALKEQAARLTAALGAGARRSDDDHP